MKKNTVNGLGPSKSLRRNEIDIEESEFINAKGFLLKSENGSGDNVYEHIVNILTRIFDERPKDAFEVFESISKDEKKKRVSQASNFRNKYEKTTEVFLADIQSKLFKIQVDEEVLSEEVESPLPNLIETMSFFEQADIGLGKEEIVKLWLAIKTLVDNHSLHRVQFWGKILGTLQNYYVVEAEFREGEETEEVTEDTENSQMEENDETIDKIIFDNDNGSELLDSDDIPKPDYREAIEPPEEEYGTGCNRKVYYVCNEPGKNWTRLPNVKPIQIQVSRKIRKLFTGSLESPVVSFPPFPGKEINYLRAQIARISAGTHVSPINYFIFDEDEAGGGGGDDDDHENREYFMKNDDYEGVNVRELVEPSQQNWVHHVNHILPQGRCKWVSIPKSKFSDQSVNNNEDIGLDDDDDEERQDDEEIQHPEIGPALLTPLSEDADVGNFPAWSSYISSKFVPQYSIAAIRSNLWMGAYGFAYNKLFSNVYIGNGLKNVAYNPVGIDELTCLFEYPDSYDVREIDDPLPEEELAAKRLIEREKDATADDEQDQFEDIERNDEFDEMDEEN